MHMNGTLRRFEQIRQSLAEQFPAFAVEKGGDRLPLARGAHQALAEQAGLSVQTARSFLYHWCRRPRYLEAVLTSEFRVGLDGKAVERIDEASREHAMNLLQAINSGGTRSALRRIQARQETKA